MVDSQSAIIGGLIARLHAGDESARGLLVGMASDRLERLARKMLRSFPGVRRWEQTGDVLQNALVRLLRALSDTTPDSTLGFFRLAALQIRRELLDMARHYSGPHGLGANHASRGKDDSEDAPGLDLADDTDDPERLEDWTRFHEAAGTLPEDERAVFDMLFYQGLTQDETAVLLGVSDRTVKRRWLAARLRISDALGGKIPGG